MKALDKGAGLADLLPYLGLFVAQRRFALAGFGLALATLASGLGLLGSSGAFLAACALVGTQAAGIGGFNMITPTGWIRLFATTRTVGRWGERVVSHDGTFRLLGGLRQRLWDRLSRLSKRQIGNWHAGELLNRFVRDIDNLDHLYLRVFLPLLAAIVSSAGLLGIIAWQAGAGSWPGLASLGALLLVSLAVLPALAYRGGKLRAPRVLDLQKELRNGLIDLVDDLEDLGLHGAAWEAQRQRLVAGDGRRLELGLAIQSRTAALRSAGMALVGLGLVVFLALCTASGMEGAWIVACSAMLLGSGEFLPQLPAAWHELSLSAASARRLTRLTDQAAEPAYPVAGAVPDGLDISIENLAFAYPDGPLVLDACTLAIPHGQHLALTGPSGSGKSSLLALITRLADSTGGRICLGRKDIRQLSEATLRSCVGLAPQDPWVFTDTLAGNLRLAKPEASDAELWAVLELVGLAKAVRSWPDGLETWVEEAGDSLSGGQRKKIGLARILLRDTPIVLLDEATEGLDDPEALALVGRLRQHLRGRTLVWVSHRPQGLEGFDRIIEFALPG